MLHILATIYFYLSGIHDSIFNYFYNVTITSIVLIPSIQAFFYIPKYPTLKKILLPLAFSNILFSAALYIWFYYNVTGSEIPYPGVADIFFLLYYPANILSLIFLSKHTRINWKIESYISFFIVFSVLATMITAFLIQNAIDLSAPTIIVFLNLAYPILDALLIATGLTIMRNQNSLSYKYVFLYVFGYIFIGIADTLFSYQSSIGNYWNGNFVDLFYAVAHALIGLGTLYLPSLLASETSTLTAESNTATS